MASTYTLISSTVLSSTTTTVTFSSIPQTYTDLVLRLSTRETPAGPTTTFYLRFNGTTSGYSDTYISTAAVTPPFSARNTGGAAFEIAADPAATATSNTFGSTEIYIPNYAGSTYKPVSAFSVSENNTSTSTDTDVRIDASLYSNTAAITTIAVVGASFVAGSSFYLYGIKNS
jgi:hypothetical protein